MFVLKEQFQVKIRQEFNLFLSFPYFRCRIFINIKSNQIEFLYSSFKPSNMKTLSTIIACFALVIIFSGCRKENVVLPIVTNDNVDDINASAVFSVAHSFSSNMVLQRNKQISVFGTASAGHTITVKGTWDNTTYSTVTDSKNNWQLFMAATAANNNAQQIEIKDNNSQAFTLTNILIGDVWICSGQSNMEMPVDSVSPYPLYEGVVNYQQEIANANYPNVRLMSVVADLRPNPIKDIATQVEWQICNPTNVKTFSAVAYFFARKLNINLNVPIGLVVSAVGGSYCEQWVSKGKLESDPVLNANYSGQHNSSQLYNGMIYPLKRMSITGFLWYQGEANRFDAAYKYTILNTALIKNWRSLFQQGALPFYLVQMTPYDIFYNNGSSPEDNDYAFFREAQAQVRTNVGNTGMAITMDVGDIQRIHPKDKKPVGERLANLALKNFYGQNVQAVGPQYLSYSVDANNKVTVKFKNGTATGLTTKNGTALNQFFFLSGPDKVFKQATAVISGQTIVITPPQGLTLPIASVRYAFTNFPITNLQNNAGLPAEPFRTDAWDDIIW